MGKRSSVAATAYLLLRVVQKGYPRSWSPTLEARWALGEKGQHTLAVVMGATRVALGLDLGVELVAQRSLGRSRGELLRQGVRARRARCEHLRERAPGALELISGRD